MGTETFTDKDTATGHFWDDGVVTKEATEEETGVKTFTCKACNATYTEDIPVKEHTHSFTLSLAEDNYLAKPATCSSAAFYYKSCRCGEAGTDTFESGTPLQHSFTHYVSDDNATCTEDGTKTAICDLCGEAKDTIKDAGSATGHSWDDGVVTTAPTADTEGVKTFTCKDCQITKMVPIPKLEQVPADPSKDNKKSSAGNQNQTSTTNTAVTKTGTANTQSPKTGDGTTLMLWTTLLMLSGISLAGTAVIKRRKRC